MTLALFLVLVDWAAEGNRAFATGRWDDALAAYERALAANPDAPELMYDRGNALYRKGEFRAASEAFLRAGLRAGLRLKPKCVYNAGNSYFRLAEQWAKSDTKQAAAIFGRAEALYEHALKLSPGFKDAEANLNLVRRRLAALDAGGSGAQSPANQAPDAPAARALPQTPEEALARERQRKTLRPKPPGPRAPAAKDW